MAKDEAPRRRPAQGYRRGEETRARIIAAALALFGENGFDGTSTRDVAARADVNAPALQYYFGSKRGLYDACLEHLQTTALERLEPALAAAEAALARSGEPARLTETYCTLLDDLADFLLGAPDARSRALFLARDQFGGAPPHPQQDVKRQFGRRFHRTCIALVARIIGRGEDEDEIELIAVTINGQLLFVHFGRRQLLDLVDWEDISSRRLTQLKAVIRRQTLAIFAAARASSAAFARPAACD